METEKASSCQCGAAAQSLHILVEALKSHRCCCAEGCCCQAAEPPPNKENKWDQGYKNNTLEYNYNSEPQENKHSLEGVWVWEGSSYNGANDTPAMVFVHTVRGKPGLLFATKLTGGVNVPNKQVAFWVRSGDGAFKNVLEGKSQVASAGYTNREYFIEIFIFLFKSSTVLFY